MRRPLRRDLRFVLRLRRELRRLLERRLRRGAVRFELRRLRRRFGAAAAAFRLRRRWPSFAAVRRPRRRAFVKRPFEFRFARRFLRAICFFPCEGFFRALRREANLRRALRAGLACTFARRFFKRCIRAPKLSLPTFALPETRLAPRRRFDFFPGLTNKIGIVLRLAKWAPLGEHGIDLRIQPFMGSQLVSTTSIEKCYSEISWQVAPMPGDAMQCSGRHGNAMLCVALRSGARQRGASQSNGPHGHRRPPSRWSSSFRRRTCSIASGMSNDVTPVERWMSAQCPHCNRRRRVWSRSGLFELHTHVGWYSRRPCRGSGQPASGVTDDPPDDEY